MHERSDSGSNSQQKTMGGSTRARIDEKDAPVKKGAHTIRRFVCMDTKLSNALIHLGAAWRASNVRMRDATM
jgi:hypothetical protein